MKHLTIIILLAATVLLAGCDDPTSDGLDCTNQPTLECRCGGIMAHETCPKE